MRWQNGTSAAKSGYKFSYETVVDYASLPYVVAGYYYYVKDHLGNVRVVLNEDGNVDISDIVAVINQIAGTASYRNSDVNSDEKVDISDIVAIINIIAGE